jgi:Protein of unknown function (DUF1592)/Protein of unknown function (DUF1588)/Protein of unknown function (DUF1595)/Protein of unknown function (DUF1587)/Protein of unknown function (DUF1585)/Planctomycete cytochrome C
MPSRDFRCDNRFLHPWLLASILASTAPFAAAMDSAQLTQAFDTQIKPFLSTYCLDCHNSKQSKGDLDLSSFTTGSSALAPSQLGIWKEAASRVHTADMPPASKPGKEVKQPSDSERTQFLTWIRNIKYLSPRDPGRGTIRRLSQVEYANTLRDLLGVDPQVANQVPKDTIGAGFSSSVSPLLMEKYLVVADEILDEAIKPEQLQIAWKAGELTLSVAGKEEPGKPDGGTRTINGPGELLTSFSAPVDGTYTIKVRAGTEQVLGGEPTRIAVRMDNQVVGELKITASSKSPKVYSVSCKLPAGRTKLSLLALNPYVEVKSEDPKRAPQPPPKPPAETPKGKDGKPEKIDKPTPRQDLRVAVIDSLEVTGPPAAKPSEIQRRLLIATPGPDLSKRDAAKQIAEKFARRAYRRPPTTGEINGLLKVFDLADKQDEPFSSSVKLMLKAVLVSPAFIYLTPDDGSISGKNDAVVALGDHQIAAKLSYLFWSTMPDEELSALADAGKLREPQVIAEQVRRLIKDPRSRTLFDGFGASWLGIDQIHTVTLDQKKFPELTKDLRTAMYEESAMLFDTILRDDRSMTEFVDNDYTFMNNALAKIYGMEDRVKGNQMTRVTLSDRNRGGVLTMPSVLFVTSTATRTSPVKRGAWVLDRVLGQKPPPPPANVKELEEQGESLTLNLRQRTERHRADPACFACHQAIDPIGFGLENFDILGRWRERDDTGAPVDSVGELPGKQRFTTPGELKRLLSAKKDDICRSLVHRSLAYALCRTLTGYDEVVADEIADAVAKDGYRFQSVWIHIATSYPFLNRRVTR